jgi:hypothetical protein
MPSYVQISIRVGFGPTSELTGSSGSGQERFGFRGYQHQNRSQPQSHEGWDIQHDSAWSGPGAGTLGAYVRIRLGDSDHTVVVTMATVRMVEVAADQKIHVVGMGDDVVPTA